MRSAMQHFEPDEFGGWHDQLSPDLLGKLDAFRDAWGAPVEVSGAPGAVGRTGEGHSQHNVDKWGEVRAVDVFPKVADGQGGYRYIGTAAERAKAYQVAKRVGFTGIGLYTDTKPGNMLHLDVRAGRQPGAPATWSRVDRAYLGIDEVIA